MMCKNVKAMENIFSYSTYAWIQDSTIFSESESVVKKPSESWISVMWIQIQDSEGFWPIRIRI